MQVLEQAVAPFDFVRGHTLRALSRSAVVTRLLGRRDARIATLGAAQVALLFLLSVRWPVAMYFLGPVVFGVLHLAADVRYLVLRVTPPRALLVASAALAVGLTVVRLCVGLGVANAALGACIDIAVGALWVGLALVLRFRGERLSLLLVSPLFVAGFVFMFFHPHATELALTHGHNAAAFVLWITLFRRGRRLGWTALPVVLVVLASAVLLSGCCAPWAALHGGLLAFGQRAARVGAGLAPGLKERAAVALAMTFVFLQSVHYAVWTGWIAQDCLPGEGTPTFRMTVRSLQRDFGRLGLAAILLVTLGFAATAAVHLRQSVGWYMTLARAHVWFEIAVFVYFVGRPQPACSLQTEAAS